MTKEQFKSIGLEIDELTGNAAIEWLANNTTIDTKDIDNFSASVKLFIKKFAEINGIKVGVSSQSIESLSQSFNTGNRNDMIMEFAEELLSPYLKGSVRFVQASSKW